MDIKFEVRREWSGTVLYLSNEKQSARFVLSPEECFELAKDLQYQATKYMVEGTAK